MFIFNSRYNTLTVVLRPVRRVVVGTQVVKEDGLSAVFTQGIFTTEDEEVANLLRAAIKKTRDNSIVEITDEDQRVFGPKKGSKNVRTAISAAEVSKTDPAKAQLVEKDPGTALTCPICDKKFKNQKSLNIHLVSHRADVQISRPLEASKAADEAEAPKVEEQSAPAEPEA